MLFFYSLLLVDFDGWTPFLNAQRDTQTDRDPLLMEQPKVYAVDNKNIVDIPRDSVASSSGSHIDPSPHPEIPIPNHEEPSSSMQVSVSQPTSSSTTTNTHANLARRSGDDYNRRRRSPLNSGLWISFELVVTLCQIIASIVILSLSRHEKPQAPLFAWIVGYASGCVATLPLLCYRFLHRNNQGSDRESASARENNSPSTGPSESTYISISIPQGQEGVNHNISRGRRIGSTAINARLNVLVDHFKMALDCFFAIWFVVGNVWIFGGHSSVADAPILYRLCIVFLTFSCIGYAMPFILCATICCCLPCIMSTLGFREDLGQTQGASSELINAFPTYKFKLKRHGSRECGEINSDSSGKGGILAAGTDKERVISGEDAVCCICLAKYGDNEELRELPCAHYFHVACVDKWLKINASCPLCKAKVCEPTSRTN